MGEHVADGHLRSDAWVRKPEIRVQTNNSVIPADITRTNKRSNDCGGDWLGKRRNLEHGIFVHSLRLTQLAETISSDQHNLVLVDDGHSKSGSIGLVLQTEKVAFRLTNRGVDVSWSR